jgi:dTDP-glucose 4,6-dehydratase
MSIMGKKTEIFKDSQRVRPERSEVERLICDNSQARRILGWGPRTSLKDGLGLTIDWFRSNVGKYTSSYVI